MASGEQSSGSSILARPAARHLPGIFVASAADANGERTALAAPEHGRGERFPALYRLLRSVSARILSRGVRSARQRRRASARLRAIHPRRQSPQLSRRRGPRRRLAEAHRLRRDAARVQREPAASGAPSPHRLDPAQPRAPGSGGDPARAAHARQRTGRGNLSRRAVQPRGTPRRGAARRGDDRVARRRAGGARGHRGHIRGAGRAPVPPAAPPPHARPLRGADRVRRARHPRVPRAEREELTGLIMAEIAALLAVEREPVLAATSRAGAS